MKVWLAKDSDGRISMFLLKPHKMIGFFGHYTFTGGRFDALWSHIPYNVLYELGIDTENDFHDGLMEVEFELSKIQKEDTIKTHIDVNENQKLVVDIER